MPRVPVGWAPDRAEIIFINHNPRSGDEVPDEHPMLVLSVQAFARRTGLVVGFPMTHAERHASNPFVVTTTDVAGRPSHVLVHQPKSFDWRARGARPHPLGGAHHALLRKVLERFNDVFAVVPTR